MTIDKTMNRVLLSARRHCKITNRGNVERIVANYIKGNYKSDTRAYGSYFSKKHTTVDFYEMATGEKLEGNN